MTSAASSSGLLGRLRGIVGRRHVLTGRARTARFATGYRTGAGEAEAVVRPGTLLEQWRVFEACVAAGRIVVVQAANTGLTGGSTPVGTYDRPVVIISTLRIDGIVSILGGRQVVCMSGATLHRLERVLKPLGREPHSVIGSSCIGASVIGGVCNSSGGALVQRGPAYTEYALYARIDADGGVSLRNHLGMELGETPEEILGKLDAGLLRDGEIVDSAAAASSAASYGEVVRGVDEPSPARFNADPTRLFEASGSAGKVMVLAVRLDTFPVATRSAVFYLGTNDVGELTRIRRRLLSDGPELPISGEYIHREAFDIADRYGRDTVMAIRKLGTSRLPLLFRAKDRMDRIGRAVPLLPCDLGDRVLQIASHAMPDQIPGRMRDYRDRYEHHLILKVSGDCMDFTRDLLADAYPSASGNFFECTPDEAERAMLHRFAVAGAAVRFRAVHGGEVEDVVALDVALRRDDEEWFERLPPEIDAQIVAKLYYGHFFCHVFHQDYIVRKGADIAALKSRMLELLDGRGAEYPAEHNVGHVYEAKQALVEHYRRLDPSNRMNPGIGRTTRAPHWDGSGRDEAATTEPRSNLELGMHP